MTTTRKGFAGLPTLGQKMSGKRLFKLSNAKIDKKSVEKTKSNLLDGKIYSNFDITCALVWVKLIIFESFSSTAKTKNCA